MRSEAIQIQPKQQLTHDYKRAYEHVADKFEYNPRDEDGWVQRLSRLKHQSYQRDSLADVMKTMNEKWDAPDRTIENIETFRKEDSTVVIAGQQAGLLTGPLYTVHKVISILQLAKKKSQELEKVVLPVFWIAGEDHDFDEINHLMMPVENKMKKMSIRQNPSTKMSVSELQLDHLKAKEWLRDIFKQVSETEFTNDLYQRFERELNKSLSYSDFFARLIYLLFPNEGLIVFDAHDEQVRKLETPYFKQMIDHNAAIAEGVYTALQKNSRQGYESVLDYGAEDAHLFYHHQGARILLVREENGCFIGKNNEVTFSREDLLKIAEENPEMLSNNVVTRPLMQELLFPVLAFIGGPGEINYWSVLKPAFSCLGLQMPPVLPRLSFTLVDRKAEYTLDKFRINPAMASRKGVGEEKVNWLSAKSVPPISKMSEQAKVEMDRIHIPLREKAAELGSDLESVADKNWEYIVKHINYLEKRMKQKLELQYENEMLQFDHLENLFYPNGGLQERVWNIVPWLNNYGEDLFERMNQQVYSFENDHYIVFV